MCECAIRLVLFDFDFDFDTARLLEDSLGGTVVM